MPLFFNERVLFSYSNPVHLGTPLTFHVVSKPQLHPRELLLYDPTFLRMVMVVREGLLQHE